MRRLVFAGSLAGWVLVAALIGVVLGSSCKTVDPVVITGDSIVAAGVTFEATAAVVNSLHASHAMTESQYAGWYTFAMRYKASFHAARLLYDAATEGGDVSTQAAAAAIIASFLSELGTYEALIEQIVRPDAGLGGSP